jgi:hypothetical protein
MSHGLHGLPLAGNPPLKPAAAPLDSFVRGHLGTHGSAEAKGPTLGHRVGRKYGPAAVNG